MHEHVCCCTSRKLPSHLAALLFSGLKYQQLVPVWSFRAKARSSLLVANHVSVSSTVMTDLEPIKKGPEEQAEDGKRKGVQLKETRTAQDYNNV